MTKHFSKPVRQTSDETEGDPDELQPSRVMRLRILDGYRGKLTKEQFISPGVYDLNDPILHGLDEYLTLNGHAEYVNE